MAKTTKKVTKPANKRIVNKRVAKQLAVAASSTKVSSVKVHSNFDVGSKFLSGGMVWRVIEAFVDNNMEMRSCVNPRGEEEIIMLSSLKKEMKDKGFKFL